MSRPRLAPVPVELSDSASHAALLLSTVVRNKPNSATRLMVDLDSTPCEFIQKSVRSAAQFEL